MDEKVRNILSEAVKHILLTEEKHTSVIVDKIGLPSDISDWITSSYPEKFQLWFANNFKKETVKRISGGKEMIERSLPGFFKGDRTQASLRNQLNRQKSYFQGAFNLINGWLRGRREVAVETDDLNLSSLSFDQAVQRADTWNDEVKKLQTGAIIDESGVIVKTYENGYYWINLQKGFCRDEAKSMGHCGNANGILYSFRKNKYPYLTADVSTSGILYQLRGRANTKPKEEETEFMVEQ